MYTQKDFSYCILLPGEGVVDRECHTLEHDAARKRISVRVQPAGSDTYDDIAEPDGASVDDCAFFDDADDRACEVIFAGLVEVRQLGGLPAQQSASVATTRSGHP